MPKAVRSGRRLLLKLLHKLGASGPITREQGDTEQRILPLTNDHVLYEASLDPIVGSVQNIDPYNRYAAVNIAHDELAFFQEQLWKPLWLDDFARISIRQAVAGQNFIKKIEQLPLPSRMKSFLNADYTAQLSTRVFDSEIYQESSRPLGEFL